MKAYGIQLPEPIYLQPVTAMIEGYESGKRSNALDLLTKQKSQLNKWLIAKEAFEPMAMTMGAVDFGDKYAVKEWARGWVEMGVPPEVFKELATALGEGDTDRVEKWRSGLNRLAGVKAQKWEPTTREEALSFERAKRAPEKESEFEKLMTKIGLSEEDKQDARKGKLDKLIEKSGSDKTYKEKIDTLMAVNSGLSKKEAAGLVIGTTRVIVDEVAGTRYLVDMITGTERKLVSEGAKPIKEAAKNGKKTIWEYSELGTGIVSAAKAAGSVVTGTVGLPVAGETLQARQFIQSSQNDLIRSLSINPRFPVGEINRLKEEVNIAPTVFDNPKMMRERIIAIDDYLRRRVEKEKDVANDETMPANDRKAAKSAAKDINYYLKLLGAPKRVMNIKDYSSVESGEQYIDPKGTLRTKP